MTQSSQIQAPKDADHNRGLNTAAAIVQAIEKPSHSIRRITAVLPHGAEDPEWGRPNVAFRLHLGQAFGDVSRIYTVREFDPFRGSFTFDVILHSHASPMMQWVGAVRAGDTLRLTGPRQHLVIPPVAGRKLALFLDETGIPAMASILRHAEGDWQGIGWIATDDQAAFAELPVPPRLDLRRIAPGAGDSGLVAMARALSDPQDHIVWGAGERGEMRAIRHHFLSAGLPREQVAIAGYWRRGVSNTLIDERRKESYEALIARGGTLADFDDLAVEV